MLPRVQGSDSFRGELYVVWGQEEEEAFRTEIEGSEDVFGLFFLFTVEWKYTMILEWGKLGGFRSDEKANRAVQEWQ